MHSSIFNFKRAIPDQPWGRLMLATSLVTLGLAAAWEVKCRSWGYAPTLNDSPDLWAMRRNAVRPDSLVIIGDSRAWFDLDLDEIERGLGRRPVQLAIPGSCAYVILADLADDKSFHGTVICSVVPLMFFAPNGSPAVAGSKRALNRRRTQTVAQKASNEIGMFLEEHIAFMKEGDLTLGELLKRLPIPNRPDALVGPPLPGYFETEDRERRARMAPQCASPGPLQDRVKHGWIALFSPPPPPTYIPRDKFLKDMAQGLEDRFKDAASAVQRIRARGGKVVFVRFPMSGDLRKLEDAATPRSGRWDRLLRDTGAPGIYFTDYPELSGFDCPEWSHLSAPDSVEFTRRLVPHLRDAVGGAGTTAGGGLTRAL